MDNAKGRIVSLNDLLLLEAGRIIEGEKELLHALPGWIQKASSTQLKLILTQYLTYIEHHAQGIEQFFIQNPGIITKGRNRAMRALVEDTAEKLHRCADPEIYDACLLAAVQEINHYKISIYGTLTAYFNSFGQRDNASLFLSAEKDEKRIDEQLTIQAQVEINEMAKSPVIR